MAANALDELEDEIAFADEFEDAGNSLAPWRILIVDDEPDVHIMTRLILGDVRFLDRPLSFVSAYSAAEALGILRSETDLAVILLDVVMDGDDAGLKLARTIRHDLGKRELRIILRTGQPGQAPQREVIVDFDINDYKSKAGLSADDLFIAVISALRSYDHIVSIETRVAERTGELTASRETLRTILDNSPMAVATLDDSGSLVFINDRLTQLIGAPKDQLIGTPASRLFANASDHDRHLAAVGVRQPLRDVEVRLCRADGSPFWALISGDPTELDGEPSYLSWILDISRRKQSEARVNQAKDEAERATRAKSVFLATMSHEIRTPMNGVLGMLELLEQSPLPANQAETVATIRESTSGLLRIIDDILDFSKIEAGRLDLERVPVSVGAIVESVAGLLRPGAVRKHLDLTAFVDPSIPAGLIGDPVRLRQILSNLGGNAVKFTHHGNIVVRVDPVVIGAGAASLRFSVSDTGIGINAETQRQLFQAYTQASPAITRQFGGTGLGLSICRHLTEMMGGQIGVISEPGTGSTFWFTLTLARTTEAVPNTLAAAELPELTGLRIAIAAPPPSDDFLGRYLSAAGASPSSFSDAGSLLAGIEAARTGGSRFDAAVIDTTLQLTAPAVLRDLIGSDPRSALGLVLLADRAPGAAPESSTGRKAVITISKPVRRHAVVQAVARAVGRWVPAPAPLAAPTPFQPDAVAKPAPTPGVQKRILVAEDNPTNRKVILMQVTMLGYAADMAVDGRQALAALQEKTYDLLLTDCHMPDMDGFELTSRVRAQETATGHHLPIIAVTANAFEGEAERFRAAGLDDYLCKPLDLQRLGAVLRKWLPVEAPAPPEPPAPRPETGTNAVLDTAILAKVCGNDPALIQEMLGEFVASSRLICRDLQRAVAERRPGAIKSGAHNLKGSSRTAGARPLADLCRRLEDAARDNDWGTILRLYPEVVGSLDAVERQINTTKGGTAP